jgi:hypothetical protein
MTSFTNHECVAIQAGCADHPWQRQLLVSNLPLCHIVHPVLIVGKREKEREEAGKHALLIKTAGMTERAICLSDPQGRDEAVAQEGAQNSVKKGVHFGTHRSRVSVHASHEALTLSLTLLARCECLKRHGVGEREGELGANFSSIVLPSFLVKKSFGKLFVREPESAPCQLLL